MALDMYTIQNKHSDKDGEAEDKFKHLIGTSFIFSSNFNESWKIKRKACSHAFYKDRLISMLEIVKAKTMESCEQWMAEIRQNPLNETTINLATEFEKILARSIAHIMFGEDISHINFALNVQDENGDWVTKEYTLAACVEVLIS